MAKILIDLNIILDFLNKQNYHREAADLINRCAEHAVSGYLCAHEVTALSYFLVKENKAGIDCIISRNISDFKRSRIPVYTPEQFFLV